MKTRLLLLLVTIFAGEGACGVMLGTSNASPQACGAGSCTTGNDCDPFACACNNGDTRLSAACIPSRGCCATESDTCTDECKPYGGWVGGGGGAGGAGGGMPTVGEACSSDGVSCGCGPDGGCDFVVECRAGTWSIAQACDYGSCMALADSSACGTKDFFTPYAAAGSPCSGTDAYDVCTADATSVLGCTDGVWTPSVDCSGEGLACGRVKPGDPGCPGASFCIACR